MRDQVCNGCRCHNPLHSLHIFQVYCHNMTNSLMMLQSKLHLMVNSNSHSQMGNHLDNYHYHMRDQICNDCHYRNPLHSLHIFQVYCHNMLLHLVLLQSNLHLKNTNIKFFIYNQCNYDLYSCG